jgi:DNA-binding NtrC family response regulator
MAERILLVEDDDTVRSALASALREAGHDLAEASSAEAALSSLTAVNPHIVLTDVRMPGMDGLELLTLLRERTPHLLVVLMTAFDDMETIVAAMRRGAFDFLVKPVRLTEIEGVIERAAEVRATREREATRREAAARQYRLDTLVGRDPQMIELYKRVGQVAASGVNALIRGATGTGKEMVARAVHYNSAAAGGPFVAVNCTAIPQTLLESELFGHVRGAFTGAVSDRRGRFALAEGGTIFLDEVGDTTPEFQAKLLRVLEERIYFPVGAEKPERTTARVLAATHRDLEVMMRQGAFREDLYYRLRVAELRVPPLRERGGDIPLLAQHFLQAAASDMHRTPPLLSDAARKALLQHDWPGNVRELENCIRRAVVLAGGDVIRAEHLGLAVQPAEDASFPTLEAVEARHVARALAAAAGNRTRAAELLGISKPTLYRYIEKYQLR